MYDYLKGIIFVCVYMLLNFLFGTAILKKYDSAPKSFVIGYITFSALLAIVGIPIQLFALSWNLFLIYMVLLIVCIIVFSIYRIRKYDILKNFDIDNFIKNNWFLLFLGIVLVVISTIYFEWYWLNNGLDDGYYINKMATLPYIDNPFRTVPGTGLLSESSIFDSYAYNIFELEASVYIYVLKIIPTLFARGFLAFINYFLFECVLYIFLEKLLEMSQIRIKKSNLQFFLVIIIIFSFSSELFSEYNLYKLQDIWQNASAMYFGSSIVRCMGILLLLLPLIGKKKLVIKDVIIYIITSLALLSKSSIVLPFSVIVAMAYVIVFLFKNKNTIKFAILFVVLIFIIGVILGNNDEISSVYRASFISNIKTIIIFISIILIIFVTYYFRNNKIAEISAYLFLLIGLTLINPINNIFEKVSMYDFVSCRFMTGIFIFLIIFSYFGLLLIFLNELPNIFLKIRYIPVIALCVSIFLGFSSMYLYNGASFNLFKNSVNLFIENKYFVPESVIILGEELEGLSKKMGEKLYTLMPEGIGINNKAYSLAISIRQFSPSTVSLSAYSRYPGTIEKDFEDYNASNQDIYGNFTTEPNEENISKFKNILDKYPINCFVSINNLDEYVAELGFKKYKQIDFQNNYYIYYRIL